MSYKALIFMIFSFQSLLAQKVNNVELSLIKEPVSGFRTRCAISIKDNDMPLYIVDGKLTTIEKLTNLNPETITSVKVIKNIRNKFCFAQSGFIVIKTKNSKQENSEN